MIYKNLKKRDTVEGNYQLMVDVAKREIEEEGIYEKFFELEEGDIVVDVGAHVGIFSKLALKKASKVYALEPDPMFIEDLKKLNDEKLVVIGSAISGKDGTSVITSDGHANEIGKGDIEISTMTFKSFIEKNNIQRIDFLKVDCEGGEYDIFTRENMPWIKENVRKITGELHIHSRKHKAYIMYMMQMLEDYNMDVILTSVDGRMMTREELESKLDYYREIIFFILPFSKFDIESSFTISYVNGCRVDMTAGLGKYDIQFINEDTDEIVYSSSIATGEWARANPEYFVKWKIRIQKGEYRAEYKTDFEGKRIHVRIESNSLGDTVAWFPYIEEFRKRHKCHMICTTRHNSLFRKHYPDIQFSEIGQPLYDLEAQYNISWYYKDDRIDFNKHPLDPRTQPMQKTASDILGLPYIEIKPMLDLPDVQKTNIVGIGMHSTTQAKYWNNPTGWQDVVDYINNIGYTPLLLSKEADGHNGNSNPQNAVQLPEGNLETLIKEICACKAFVGVGTGLSWVAWACNIPVILVSGFSESYTEMQSCIRIDAPVGKCRGCFNRHKLESQDWWWCPDHKGTPRQFECSRFISSSRVIDSLKQIIN